VKTKFTKGENWSTHEDDLLVQAWVHTSLDAVIGTDQSSSSYWGRIYDYCNTRKKVSWSVHNQNAPNCRWTAIKEQANKFCRCYQQILNRNQSGVIIGQQVCIHLFNSILNFHELCVSLRGHLFVQQALALVLYQSKDARNRPFTLMHCWLELQKHAKWETHPALKGHQKKQKKTSDASPGTTSNDEDFVACTDSLETEIRSPGNKSERECLRTGKASASDAFGCKLSLETAWA
jgi:hypothetical protein